MRGPTDRGPEAILNFKLRTSSWNNNIRQHFFTNRVVKNWNALTYEVVNAPSINAFKNRLDKVWARYMYLEDLPTQSLTQTRIVCR